MKILIIVAFLLAILSAVIIPVCSQEAEKKEKEEFITLREASKIIDKWEGIGDLPFPAESPLVWVLIRQNPGNREERAKIIVFVTAPKKIFINSFHFLNGDKNRLTSYYWGSGVFAKYYYPEADKETGCGACHQVPTKMSPGPDIGPKPEQKPQPPERKGNDKKSPPLLEKSLAACQNLH